MVSLYSDVFPLCLTMILLRNPGLGSPNSLARSPSPRRKRRRSRRRRPRNTEPRSSSTRTKRLRASRRRNRTVQTDVSPRPLARVCLWTGATRCVSPLPPPRTRWRRLPLPGSSLGLLGRRSFSTHRGCPRRASAGRARRRATGRRNGGTTRGAGPTRGGAYARAKTRFGSFILPT